MRAACLRTGFFLLAIALSFSFANAAKAQILTGEVLAGTTPIKRATVTLYGTVTISDLHGSHPTSRPVEETLTDAEGQFSLDLSKAHATVQEMVRTQSKIVVRKQEEAPGANSLYLVASGGDVGKGNNAAIKLATALGGAPPEGHVIINELTTVVAAFPLNRITLTDLPPREESFVLARQLVDPVTGKLRPVFDRGANSHALVNTLADILHGCVTSAAPGFNECDSLFKVATLKRWNQKPENTLRAIENIVSTWGHGQSSAFALLPKERPYTPVLDHPPAGWLLSLNFQNLGLHRPTQILGDWSDHTLWILNRGNHSLVELSTDPQDLAAPLLGERRLPADVRNGSTAFWFPAGQIEYLSKARPKRPGWFSEPSAWLVGDKLIFLKSDGSLCGTPSDSLGLKDAGGIWRCSIFGDGLCIANSGADEILAVNEPYYARCGETKLLGRLKGAIPECGIVGHGVCIANVGGDGDHSDMKPLGRLNGVTSATPQLGLADPRHSVSGPGYWVTNRANNSVSAFSDFNNWWPVHAIRPTVFFHQLTVLQGSPFHGSGLAEPEDIARDGGRNVWIANHARNANSVTELQESFDRRGIAEITTLSPESGFSGIGMNRPYGVAVDGLGNVWVSNEGNDSLTVFIGAGQPQ